MESVRNKVKHDQCYHDHLTEEDRSLIQDIVAAYEQTAIKVTKTYSLVCTSLCSSNSDLCSKVATVNQADL